ncbi:11843_t:CDS:2, partial [Acaulospora colombiana]
RDSSVGASHQQMENRVKHMRVERSIARSLQVHVLLPIHQHYPSYSSVSDFNRDGRNLDECAASLYPGACPRIVFRPAELLKPDIVHIRRFQRRRLPT